MNNTEQFPTKIPREDNSQPPFNLIVTAAGRGSRIAAENKPKPLIDLWGRYFFEWAVGSVYSPATLTFVVLKEHVDNSNIDVHIKSIYPQAEIIALPDVTRGAAETAYIGISKIKNDYPIGVLDCDLAFKMHSLPTLIESITLKDNLLGGLCCFSSNSPLYSYASLNQNGEVTGTVEKQPVSDKAIAGFYIFKNKEVFQTAYNTYENSAMYPELYVSGLYNILLKHGKVAASDIDARISFGTSDELKELRSDEQLRFKWQ